MILHVLQIYGKFQHIPDLAWHGAVPVLYVHFQVGNSFCSASPWLNSAACNYDGGDCW
jgi:hypothetical protein